MPPLRAFAAHLIELEHTVRLSPAGIVGNATSGDQGPRSFVHDAPGLIFVHAEKDEVSSEVSRLRDASDDRPVDVSSEWILSAGAVCSLVAEERLDVAKRRCAGTKHVRIGNRVYKLI